jgi:hypothetical protein
MEMRAFKSGGSLVLVNLELVQVISQSGDGSRLYFKHANGSDSDFINVDEDIITIMDKLEEWRITGD